MSEVEHYKGKLKPTCKDIESYLDDCVLPDWYDSKHEYFEDMFSENAIFFEGQVYEIDKTACSSYEDIFESTKNEDGTIDFEVKYYNGGCGFSEALEYALK